MWQGIHAGVEHCLVLHPTCPCKARTKYRKCSYSSCSSVGPLRNPSQCSLAGLWPSQFLLWYSLLRDSKSNLIWFLPIYFNVSEIGIQNNIKNMTSSSCLVSKCQNQKKSWFIILMTSLTINLLTLFIKFHVCIENLWQKMPTCLDYVWWSVRRVWGLEKIVKTPTIRQLHQYCQIEGVWAIKGKNCSMKQLGLGLYYIQTWVSLGYFFHTKNEK